MPDELQQTAPDTQTKRLNRQALGSPAGVPILLIFGVIFTGAGSAILLLALDVIKVSPHSILAPRWVIEVIGAIFAGAGLLMLMNGVRGVCRAIRRRQRAGLFPAEPWRADFAWDPSGFTASDRAGVLVCVAFGLFVVLFMTPFNWWGFRGGGGLFVIALSGVFDLVGLGLVGYALFLVLRWLKYGDSRLQFEGFPFFLGDVVTAALVPHKDVRGCRRVTFTLRCIQERIETTGSGENRSTAEVCYQIWASAFEVEQPGDIAAGHPVPVTFLLPEDAGLSTALADRPPRYWEVEVAAATPGINYKARFLVPVYIRPAGPGQGLRNQI